MISFAVMTFIGTELLVIWPKKKFLKFNLVGEYRSCVLYFVTRLFVNRSSGPEWRGWRAGAEAEQEGESVRR
jgi:hypothetical protein